MGKEQTAPQEQGAVAAYRKLFLNGTQLHAYSAATIARLQRHSRVFKKPMTIAKGESMHARLFRSCFANHVNLQIRIEFAG